MVCVLSFQRFEKTPVKMDIRKDKPSVATSFQVCFHRAYGMEQQNEEKEGTTERERVEEIMETFCFTEAALHKMY